MNGSKINGRQPVSDHSKFLKIVSSGLKCKQFGESLLVETLFSLAIGCVFMMNVEPFTRTLLAEILVAFV